MPALLRIDVDTAAVIKALTDFAGPVMERHVRLAARTTAERITAEALTRVRRKSGRTARGIRIQSAEVGTGYVVLATNPDNPGLPGWLEFGTERMTAKPFFFVAAQLEEGAYDRRIRTAVQDAIDEVGLGE